MRVLAVGLALAAAGVGVISPAARAASGNGLYAPFPGGAKKYRVRTFLAKASLFLPSNEVEHGKFLTPGGPAPALLRTARAGPSLRAGVDDPEDPGAGGWALGGAVVILVLAVGAAGSRVLDRSIRQSANRTATSEHLGG